MLAKSGLLEITMKTADLIRSNQQAQRELEQLKVFSPLLFGERVFAHYKQGTPISIARELFVSG